MVGFLFWRGVEVLWIFLLFIVGGFVQAVLRASALLQLVLLAIVVSRRTVFYLVLMTLLGAAAWIVRLTVLVW